MQLLRRLGIPLVAASVAATIATLFAPTRPIVVAGGAASQSELKPLVETHEFMEHVEDRPDGP